jgi:hypothetical protein
MISNKKAAMEMSVGTIVTIILLMSVLVLGVVLITNIFSGAKDVVDMGNEQLKAEMDKLFSKEDKISIYPQTRHKEIKQGEINGVGLGIRNKLSGASGETRFSYQVVVSDPDLEKKCGVRVTEAENWITTGRQEKSIAIPSGDFSSQKILFDIPVGAPLCTIRYRVNVDAGTQSYATDYFDITIVGA